MKYQKYYDLIKKQSERYDKAQNCNIGQTWKFHLLPVIKNACMLAEKYNADKDVVEVAAIFHDYADLLDLLNRDIHHILGAELAEGILLQDGFPQDFIDKVKKCIQNHRAMQAARGTQSAPQRRRPTHRPQRQWACSP